PHPARAPSELSERAMTSTKPGVAAVRARTAAAPTDEEMLVTTPRPVRPSSITIGAAIVERQSVRHRGWLWLAALLVAAAGAAVAVVVVTRDGSATAPKEKAPKEPPPPVAKETSTVKFMTEPADAEIAIEGKDAHRGSPWTIELAPGTYTVNIQREGFKARLMSIEVSAKETNYIVPLEKLAVGAAAADATLLLSSSPGNLDAYLDGKPLGQRTPLRLAIKPGPHTVVLRQNGVEVWRQYINAQANADYQFNPNVTEAQAREREARERRRAATAEPKKLTPDAPTSTSTEPTPTSTEPAIEERTTDKARPPVVEKNDKNDKPPVGNPKDTKDPTTPVPTPPTPQVKVELPPPPPTTEGARSAGPVIVTPNAVTKISGETPNVAKSKRAEMPSTVAAKVCIDTSGKVTNVSVITQKLERMTVGDLTSALYAWRYKPHMVNGVATPACFVVSFQVK
ncbi:MAG: PEGA domain-containing protein, partial [Deltaproteobacteria bacterium]|nr:PEGA domain-containing protein [Deltaproteobacteria bacterium]